MKTLEHHSAPQIFVHGARMLTTVIKGTTSFGAPLGAACLAVLLAGTVAHAQTVTFDVNLSGVGSGGHTVTLTGTIDADVGTDSFLSSNLQLSHDGGAAIPLPSLPGVYQGSGGPNFEWVVSPTELLFRRLTNNDSALQWSNEDPQGNSYVFDLGTGYQTSSIIFYGTATAHYDVIDYQESFAPPGSTMLVGTAVPPLACPTAPAGSCAPGFGNAVLVVNEKSPGKEKLVAKFLKGPAITQSQLGDPTTVDGTGFALCLYDDGGALVNGLLVDKGGEDCGTKPCWTSLGGDPPTGSGYKYTDKDTGASGVKTMLLKAGPAGKPKLLVIAANNAPKGQTAMPTGTTAALTGAASVTMHLIGDDGACYEATLTDIKKQDSDLFKAK
jgi:hypothetical protein